MPEDKKFTGLPAGSPADDMLLAIAEDPGGTAISKSITGAQLKAQIEATLTPADRAFTSTPTTGDGSATGKTITASPRGDIYLEVNGLKEEIGDGVKTTAAYFSNDGGSSARALVDIAPGDALHWNGGIAGYELAGSDRLSLVYET